MTPRLVARGTASREGLHARLATVAGPPGGTVRKHRCARGRHAGARDARHGPCSCVLHPHRTWPPCLRISATPSREPASSRAMARNEAGRGRAKAHEAVRVCGRTSRECAGSLARVKRYSTPSIHRGGRARASCRLRHGRTEQTSRPQARSSVGRARTPAPHGLACARLTYRWVPGRARELARRQAAPGLDPGPRDAGCGGCRS